MLARISFILLLSFSLCLAETPKLRSEAVFRPALLIDLLKDTIEPLNILPNLVFSATESDYLNEFAQSLAETSQNPINFINNYPRSKYTKGVLTFGFKLRGDVPLETILMKDSTEVVDHMSGFLDFRIDNATLSMEAKEIRNSIKVGRCFTRENYTPEHCKWTKSSGFLTVNSGSFVHSVNLKSIRDILPIMKLYDLYLDSQLKTLNQDGTVSLGFQPLTLRMEMKNFKLNLESTSEIPFPFRVDTSLPREELYDLIDHHHRTLIQNISTEQALHLSRRINTMGFGIALDSNGDINIVYALGQQGDYTPRNRLTDRLNDYVYVTPKGNRIDLNPYDFVNNTLIAQQLKYNRIMMDAENLYRLNEGLRPIRYADARLYEFALNEASRMAKEGRLSAPSFAGQTKDMVVIAMYTVGKTTVREFVFDVNDEELGSISCYDNFSNTRPKVYRLFESFGQICNKDAIRNWKLFDTIGSGIASNQNGDIVNVVALTRRSADGYCLNKSC